MSVNIHGKEYTTVAERISMFRDAHANYSLESEILSNADIVVIKAVIRDDSGRAVATGHAEEVRGSTNINKTSALENCETSAWGRALAALNFGGDQVASANEVSDAIIQQTQQEVASVFYAHNKAVFDNITSLIAIRESIANNDYSIASEAWNELTQEIQSLVWRAPSKGGFFTTKEREIIKSSEFREAHES